MCDFAFIYTIYISKRFVNAGWLDEKRKSAVLNFSRDNKRYIMHHKYLIKWIYLNTRVRTIAGSMQFFVYFSYNSTSKLIFLVIE